jgi:small GTP-binding protein
VLDEYSTNVMIDQRPVTVGLWDTAGQTDYDRLRPLSYPQTDVFIVAYAVSNQDSFENVTKKWIPEITQHSAAPFILLATKADHREDDTILKPLAARGKSCVSTEQGRQVAEENGAMGFFEVSAKNLTGLQEAMDRVIRTGLSMVLGDIEPKLPPKPQPPAVTNGPELCDDLELLVNEKQTHDVVFRVGDREIYGHKIVLSSACEALERLILDGVAVSEFFTAKMVDHVCLIEVNNRVTDETLLIFLTCIYSGKQSESASTGVKNLANACGLDITLDRHIGLQKKIAVNMDKMWDFEIVADDKTRFRASKALLWCRSGYFKSLFEDANVKHVDVDMSSSLVEGVLEYVVSGTVSHHQIEELLKVSTKWESPGLLSTCEYILVQDVITLKNVFKWSAIAFQDMLYPKLRDYCIWLMRINYHVIKDKKEFQELPGGEVGSVMGGAWPGEHYKEMRAKWKQKHGKKDRCLLQ